MNVTYEKKDAMTFIGYHTEIRPEEGYQKCPEFWDKEYAAKYARLWQTMKPENPPGGGLSKVSGILGQGIRSQICETLADDEAGECCGKSDSGKWDRYVCNLCRF